MRQDDDNAAADPPGVGCQRPGHADLGAAAEALPYLAADALPVLISYVDAGQRYRFVNRTYEDWFGHPRAEVVGRTVRECSTPLGMSGVGARQRGQGEVPGGRLRLLRVPGRRSRFQAGS